MLARVLVGDDDDELGDLATDHPAVELRHDLLDVGLDLVVGRHEHVEAILLHGREVLGWVDAALEEDRVDRVEELRSIVPLAGHVHDLCHSNSSPRGYRQTTYKLGH